MVDVHLLTLAAMGMQSQLFALICVEIPNV